MTILHHSASPGCNCRLCLLATSAALFELRDALLELSMALKDWQFETDLELRASVAENTRHLLAGIASTQAPRVAKEPGRGAKPD